MLAVAFYANAQNVVTEDENPSAVLYQKIQPVEDVHEDHTHNEAPSIKTDNSTASRTAVIQSVSWNGGSICTTPDVHASGSDCCSYGIYDQIASANRKYRQPKHVFASETEARTFAATVKASMPMFLPYKDSNVYPAHGWFYQNGDFHGAIDYLKVSSAYGEDIDPTFGVYAIADGKVISVLWDDWLGNIVVLEHVAPNGKKFRTVYMHLRNGFTNDIAKAKAAVVPAGSASTSNASKYKKFANLEDPSTQHWGTNAQKIKVTKGAFVKAGQLIAYSGNTGQGGAGNGLNTDGTPKNVNTANNHLHLMTVVPDPRPDYSKDWVQVDPYGVYSQVSNADGTCYDLLKDTPYARLFAAFYPSFHNVPLSYVSKYFNYYTGMGMALQTISVHRKGSTVLASGSFQSGLPSQWKARLYMSAADFNTYHKQYHDQGYRPREISVTPDGSGVPRFTVIWKKRTTEGYYTYFNLTDAQFQAKWNTHVVQGKMFVADHVSYKYNGNKHAVVFVSSSKPAFYEYHYMSAASFNSKVTSLNNSGYHLTSINVAELANGTFYGGVWRPKTTGFYVYHGMSPATYQTKFNTMTSQGYRLHRIQGYANSTKFAAIWVKTPITNVRTAPDLSEVIADSDDFFTISPNPASDKGAIEFHLQQPESGKLVIKDIMGRKTQVVRDGNFHTGKNTIEFNTGGLNSGLHVVEYISDSRKKTSKLLITK